MKVNKVTMTLKPGRAARTFIVDKEKMRTEKPAIEIVVWVGRR